MKTKPKYRAEMRITTRGPFGQPTVMRGNVQAAECFTITMARKIARALNAMEKPKAKPFKFDWSGIPKKYKWAAMDADGEWVVFVEAPNRVLRYWDSRGKDCLELGYDRPIYPVDWRDSLQKRP